MVTPGFLITSQNATTAQESTHAQRGSESGLSFREAQTMTHRIAAYFDDKRYKIALGSLSDGETYDGLPRHISKIFSLCIAYGMDLWQYLRAGGVPVDELNGAAIPQQFLHDDNATVCSPQLMPMVPGSDQNQATESVIQRLGEVPFFLLLSVGSIIGQEELSWMTCTSGVGVRRCSIRC